MRCDAMRQLRALSFVVVVCRRQQHLSSLVGSVGAPERPRDCLSKYKHLYCETANGSFNQLLFI